MTNQLYTATGCARCNITKRFMQENDIPYAEYDFKGDGKEAFAQFYRTNRKDIFRDKDGVEFPVFTDGNVIRQGVSVVISYLIAGDDLRGFIGRSILHGEWLDGICVSGGKPERMADLLKVLAYLKQNGLKIQISTDGRNAAVLEAVKQKNLADCVIMDVRGTAGLYGPLTGATIDEGDLKRSITLAAGFPEYRFQTSIAPMMHQDGKVDYITPAEVGETARMIETATGSKKHSYELYAFDPECAFNEALKAVDPLPAGAMFKYRSAARRYMVMTEIAK